MALKMIHTVSSFLFSLQITITYHTSSPQARSCGDLRLKIGAFILYFHLYRKILNFMPVAPKHRVVLARNNSELKTREIAYMP